MTLFTVWAPRAERVELCLGRGEGAERREMLRAERHGWWELAAPDQGPGADYAFALDGGVPRPDPRSRFQPHGVHEASRMDDPGRFAWTDQDWPGLALDDGVVYELHVGTFTAEGTFDAAIGRLDYLVALGVDFVEVMPVAAFPGQHGWGYDGVDLWAVHEPYGGPEGLRRFVDACHARGIGVVLDVVYNHLGPSGNYLGEFGPYFTEKHQTPWGAAVNLDDAGSDEVRAFIVGNALNWFSAFHLDALRLDAVHALADTRAIHVLEELSLAVDELAEELGRPLTLIAETDLNDPRIITPRGHNGLGVHAQWNDDFHHALHSLLTGERQGYYADFGSIAALAKTLEGAYFHDGTWSSFRGRSHGRPVDTELLGGGRFVVFLQDHDQVGNRALGDRISAALSPGRLRIGAALLLTSPFVPMLFMGEEWGASTPWCYFTDHQEPELGRAVREGRRREFSAHGWAAEDVPDPQDPDTFARSRLDWAEPLNEPGRALFEWYRALIALRRDTPELASGSLRDVGVEYDERARWLVVRRGAVRIAVNLAAEPRSLPVGAAVLDVLLASAAQAKAQDDVMELPPESVAIVLCESPAVVTESGF
jgi:maltooligosyltrehalose trehalohydrolase